MSAIFFSAINPTRSAGDVSLGPLDSDIYKCGDVNTALEIASQIIHSQRIPRHKSTTRNNLSPCSVIISGVPRYDSSEC